MKVNENQLYSLYSPQKVHSTPARASKPDNVQKSEQVQKFSLKETAPAAAGVTKTFSDILSGARDDRPGLQPSSITYAKATPSSSGN